MPTSTETNTERAAAIAQLAEQLLLHQVELNSAMEQRLAEDTDGRSDVSDGPGETEHLVVAEQHENNARLDAISRLALAEVEGALQRIEDGTYGHCITCGDEIPLERLEIRPATPVCVRCQAEYEGD